MRDKITKRTIDGLRAEAQATAKTIYLWDTEATGFGALATKNGSCSYFIEYRLGGRGSPSKRVTLGKHGVFTPDEARKLARERLGDVARGTDVAQVKKDERQKLSGVTFADLAEIYLSIHAKPTRYWREKRARLKSDDVKAIQNRPMAIITRAEIAAVMGAVQARSLAAARLLFADIRPIFSWALNGGAIETNPMAGMDGPKPSPARERVLSDDEVKAFWRATERLGGVFAPLFKLLLLTAQRREEVAGLSWQEIDFDKAVWIIPGERCKNGKPHHLDLSPQALTILKALHDERDAERALVFSTTGETSVSGFSKAKERLDRLMTAELGKPLQPWRTHDLRRTAASGMAGLGFQPHVIERVLNHVSGAQGGLVSVYQLYEYREDRKRAMIAWDEHLAVINDQKVERANAIEAKAL